MSFQNPPAGLEPFLVDAVRRAHQRLSPALLVERARRAFPGLRAGHVRSALRSLVDSGELRYSYHFGQSWVEFNYNRPIPLSSRFILVPESSRRICVPGKKIIRLASGGAFGAGDHPTTRLALAGLDFLVDTTDNWIGGRRPAWGLDIGTGTGILALAAMKLGLDFVNAFDIDACARFEARRNVEINGLSGRIFVGGSWPESKVSYMLVMANLRLPTIKHYSEPIARHMSPGAFLLVSGIRPEEVGCIERTFDEKGFKLLWSSCDGGWCSGVLRRQGG